MTAVLKRLILWDYQRGVWQYDVMCFVILLFIAFSPREWFRDQPRSPQATQIASLTVHGESMFVLEPEMVLPIPEADRKIAVGKILSARYGKNETVMRVEPIYDAEQEIKCFMAFAKP